MSAIGGPEGPPSRQSQTYRSSHSTPCRRNNARYKKGQEESILFHKVPDRDMLGFFRDNDWADITAGAPDGWLALAGVRVPFVSMHNEPESTDPLVLRARYAGALGRLMELYRTR